MDNVKAIGFDLFNTLITADPRTLEDANRRLIKSLEESGFSVEEGPFFRAHRDAAVHFLEECRKDGRETHNRFWISSALEELGQRVDPDDPVIGDAVEAYFSAFYEHCRLIPGTIEMLSGLNGRYRVGLLSNFTHAPAARRILDRLGLIPFLDPILISGELGYRKPHPSVFHNLLKAIRVKNNEIIYVGDDPEADVAGALAAGLRPVWTTYVSDRNIPMTSGILGRGTGRPDPDVPRISNWRDLLDLLEGSDSEEL